MLQNNLKKDKKLRKASLRSEIIDVRSTTHNFATELPPCGLKIASLRFKIRVLKLGRVVLPKGTARHFVTRAAPSPRALRGWGWVGCIVLKKVDSGKVNNMLIQKEITGNWSRVLVVCIEWRGARCPTHFRSDYGLNGRISKAQAIEESKNMSPLSMTQ